MLGGGSPAASDGCEWRRLVEFYVLSNVCTAGRPQSITDSLTASSTPECRHAAHVGSRHAPISVVRRCARVVAGRSEPSLIWASAAQWVAPSSIRRTQSGLPPRRRRRAAFVLRRATKVLWNHAAIQNCPPGLQRPTRSAVCCKWARCRPRASRLRGRHQLSARPMQPPWLHRAPSRRQVEPYLHSRKCNCLSSTECRIPKTLPFTMAPLCPRPFGASRCALELQTQ